MPEGAKRKRRLITTLRHYGAKQGNSGHGSSRCRAVARRGYRMLPSITAFKEEQQFRDDGHSGSGCASGSARQLRAAASRKRGLGSNGTVSGTKLSNFVDKVERSPSLAGFIRRQPKEFPQNHTLFTLAKV
jgi:hypothetical protein